MATPPPTRLHRRAALMQAALDDEATSPTLAAQLRTEIAHTRTAITAHANGTAKTGFERIPAVDDDEDF